MAFALEIHGLCKRYAAGAGGSRATVDALRDVHLSVSRGEAVALVGAAGAGKTTLLLCAAGLLRPDAGSVAWFGGSRRGRPEAAGAPPRHVAYACPIRPAGLGAAASTLRELLERAAGRGGRLTRERRRAIDDALGGAALADRADARLPDLPPELQWRVPLAQALLVRPALLLLDDLLAPAVGGGVGVAGSVEAGRLATARCVGALTERGAAVVIAARDTGLALEVASRTVLIRDGRTGVGFQQGPPPGVATGSAAARAERAQDAHRVRVAEEVSVRASGGAGDRRLR